MKLRGLLITGCVSGWLLVGLFSEVGHVGRDGVVDLRFDLVDIVVTT